jgi:hypothetical protein
VGRSGEPRVIHLTFDQDWAPAWATERLAKRVQDAGLQATLFVTHDCPSLAALRSSEAFELGWHPNFLPGSSHGADVESVLDFMAQIVPEAVGARAHTLMRGTPLLEAYKRRGLRYDGADLHDGVANLEVFQSWTGVSRIPIWFEDDVHLQRGLGCELGSLSLDTPGLKVCTFHPVLVALNCADLDSYGALKADLAARGVGLTDATVEDFARFRQSDRLGVGDLFESLVSWLEAHPASAGSGLATLVD